jgi:hypothetical protein
MEKIHQLSFVGAIGNTNHADDLMEFVEKNYAQFAIVKRKKRFEKSPFRSITQGNPHERGAFGVRIVNGIAANMGFVIEKSGSGSQSDTRINGINTEIKTAFQKEDGKFILNQIRDQDYDFVVTIVIEPQNVHIFTVPKLIMLSHCTGQHSGKNTKDTRIFTGELDRFYSIFGKYEGLQLFEMVFKKQYVQI